jgi:hypothetical protein
MSQELKWSTTGICHPVDACIEAVNHVIFAYHEPGSSNSFKMELSSRNTFTVLHLAHFSRNEYYYTIHNTNNTEGTVKSNPHLKQTSQTSPLAEIFLYSLPPRSLWDASSETKLNLSRSQNRTYSHAYNACLQLSRLQRMYYVQH